MNSPKPSIRIGIDLGGTKIEAIALHQDGRILTRQRVSTPTSDAGRIVRAIADLVDRIEASLGLTGTVGIGTPGALSPTTGLLRNSNSICLNGLPFHAMLESALNRPIRIANDANCFALSEAIDGAAAGAKTVFGVILGTGVGGGVVIDGRVLMGRNAIAGEWGHNPLPAPDEAERPGPPCYCGRRGCIETFLSGPALSRCHADRTGTHLSTEAIAEAAGSGDPACRRTLAQYQNRLARALASVINILDPDIIVLGGGLSNIEALYRAIPEIWGQYIFSDHVTTDLLPPRHGDSSGVRGAAWLWSPSEVP